MLRPLAARRCTNVQADQPRARRRAARGGRPPARSAATSVGRIASDALPDLEVVAAVAGVGERQQRVGVVADEQARAHVHVQLVAQPIDRGRRRRRQDRAAVRAPPPGAAGRRRGRPARPATSVSTAGREPVGTRRQRESARAPRAGGTARRGPSPAACSSSLSATASSAVVRPSAGLGQQQQRSRCAAGSSRVVVEPWRSVAPWTPSTSSRGPRQPVGRGRSATRRGAEPLDPQLGLDRRDRRAHERQALRRRDLVAAGEVEDAEHGPGVGVVDRRRRAAPRRDLPGQVLGPEDLHRPVERERRARARWCRRSPRSSRRPARSASPRPSTRSRASPSTHSSWPAASLTATSRPASAALSTSSRRITGMPAASGCSSRICCERARRRAGSRRAPRSGSSPPRRLRRHDSRTTERTGPSTAPVERKASWASCSTRASASGSTPDGRANGVSGGPGGMGES